MNRKIRVMILTMVLTVLMFGGTRLMAQDLSNKPSETQTTPDEEKSKEEGSLAKTNENEEGSEIADNAAKDTTEDNNGAVLPKGSDNPDLNKTATENNNENLVKEAPKTKAEGAKILGEETKTEEQVKAKEALEANKAKEEGKGKEDGAKANPQKAPLAEPNKEEQGAPEKKTEEKKNDSDKPQIDTKTDKDLNDLQSKINAEQDPKKKAELQKEYNEKYLEKVEAEGKDKLDPELQERLTEDGDIKNYNIIKNKQKELKEKREAIDKMIASGQYKQKELDTLNDEYKKAIEEYNKLVGSFNPPRKLTAEETEIKKDYTKKPYINIDEKNSSPAGKAKYKEYKKYKEALDKALDPKNNGLTAEEYKNLGVKDLKGLKAKFDQLNKEVLRMIDSTDPNEKIEPAFSEKDGTPKVDIYAYDFSGSVDLNKPIENGKNYYIPDGTKLDLFVQVGRKNDGSKIKFTLTPKKVGKPEGRELSARDNVIYLNGKEINLKKVNKDDGSYYYEFETSDNFGVAQLKFTIPAIYGELHEGFNIGIQVGDKEISNNFLITKKGYDENPETGSIGNTDIENPKEEDAGKTEGSKVTEHTDKLFNIFAMLKESNGYIDKVLVNSSNGQALPLAHVKITMTLPKNYDGNFAKYIHKSGLKYEEQGNGVYVLELDTKEFGKNLVKKDDGFYLKGGEGKEDIKLEQASEEELKNALLTGKDGKTYVDENGKEHKVTTVEVLENETNNATDAVYRLIGKTVQKKNAQGTFEDVCTLNDKNIGTSGDLTYELRGDTLLIYDAKKVEDVYDGHVSNKDGKAEPKVTPTDQGKQVTIKESESSTEESYGGTIVENAIFDKDNKYIGKTPNNLQGETEAWIDETGKKVDEPTGLTDEQKNTGKVLINGKLYTKVKNAVFEKNNKNDYYIIDCLSYSDKLSLIDKFGRKMDIKVTEDKGTYTFTKNSTKETKDSNDSKITVGTNKEIIFVNSKNYKVDTTKNSYTEIVGKYYYDEKNDKFESLEEAAKKKNIIGDKYYPDLVKALLKRKTIETYTTDDGKNLEVPDKAKKLYGSQDKKDYYKKAGGKYYAMRTIGEGENQKTIFVSEDEVLTADSIKRIVQVYQIGSQKLVDVDSIFNAINQAKFQIKFPGFLAGKKVVYTLKTDIAADYEHMNANGKPERISIYKKDGNHVNAKSEKTINKYFTLKNEEKKDYKLFFKEHPDALEKNLDYNFFNIFFRDGSDRQRDAYIGKLIQTEKDSETDENLKKTNKKELDLLAKLRKELRRLTGNEKADFKFTGDENNKSLIIVDENGKEINVNRTLLWKVGFNNPKGVLFPKDSDSEITIEDHNMDNRLVYDEIIINHTEENWKKIRDSRDKVGKAQRDLENAEAGEVEAKKKALEDAKQAVEKAKQAVKETKQAVEEAKIAFEKVKKAYETDNSDANKKALEEAKKTLEEAKSTLKEKEKDLDQLTFKGTDQYFFLNQIKRIFLGVNPNYKDYRFVPAGENYLITREDIKTALNSLNSNNEGTITKGTGENAISYKVTYDPTTAQIKIKVFDAFYKQHTATTEDPNHFESPVQKGYQEWLNGVEKSVEGLTTNTVTEFQDAFNNFIKSTYGAQSDCFGVLKQKFDEMIKKINKSGSDEAAKQEKIVEFKKAFEAELEKLKLAYLDRAKNGGKYKFDDMRFNALRIELEAGQTIGGAMDSTKKKYLGITSVIVPDVDIPLTDEFGDKLTNKDLYLNQEVKKILKNGIGEGQDKKTYKEADLNDEFKFRKIMEEAYKRVNALKDKDGKSLIKYLVTVNDDKVGIEKYNVKRGSEFKYNDFAIGEGADKKSLKDGAGHTVNPYFIGDGENPKTAEENIEALLKIYGDKINAEEFKNSDLYKELTNPEIEIGLYYMHVLGYNRAKFANKAKYKLNKVHQGPGIFGKEDNWKNKVCYPGIGQCIENAGGDKFPGEEGNKAEDEKKMKAEDDFSLSYSPATPNFESENPKFDKRSETGKIDFSNEKDKNKKVDYTVELTVDKLKTDQKIGGDSTKPIDPKAAAEEAKNYNKRGYFVYKNSLIIDFLPEIFRFENGSSMTLTIDEKALTANGANKYDGFNINEFKAKAKPIYVENVYEYLKTLSGDQKTALEKAIALAEEQGKLDRNGNKHAVLAWLPDFEAPHGSSKPQFTLKINQLVVDKKQFKEYEAHKYSGEKFTNHAVFDIFYANHPITITDGHKGNVDKTMRIYDEKGNIVNKDKAEEWFRGYVELKFGDQYDYKIKYKHVKPGYEDINSSNRDKEAEFVDFFATKDKNNGFRPVLRELLDLKDGFYAEYSLNGKTFLSKKDIEDKLAKKEITLGDIQGVKIKHERGFEINKEVEFVLPMMIPNLDAKVEGGKVYYIGQDGKRVDLGNADKYFKLDKLKSSKEKDDMFATNTVDGSNTVTVYLEKERFIRVFKEFLAANGEKLKNLDNLEAKFDVYQIIEENGKKTRVKLDKQLIVNKKNDFTDMIDHLPIFKKTTTVKENGTVKVDEIKYEYELVEAEMPGFESKVYKLDDSDKLGFVWQATNTEKPHEPEYPGENPKDVTVTIRVNKVWEVLNNRATPSIKVQLYANGEPTDKFLTLGDGNWSAVFKDLPAKDKDGKDIVYTVVEVGETNHVTEIGERKFEVSYSIGEDGSITITNKEIPPEEPKDEKPKDKKEPKKHKPNDEEGRDRTPKKNRIPKTGVAEDLGAIYFAFVLLLGLVFIKKRYLVK